ncbi:hypothetical protein OEB94_09190 [Streptomyces sp. ICN988]|uniref:hypothetical protein n=1 Tax=Streptomyces sp. ICN988 TaxID=2983765 RepID=UPI0021E4A959|nr:hypothetical protein [Streptomyces sp. ICN988]MCV2459434.1 hypothetical protein [Streptomyces sp. ICN988]
MTVSIIHAFLLWALSLLLPGTGQRRANPGTATPHTADVHAGTALLPLPRSPYGANTPLNGTAAPLVRPYVVACEYTRERARQRRRRLTLVIAADFGLDLDRHMIDVKRAA